MSVDAAALDELRSEIVSFRSEFGEYCALTKKEYEEMLAKVAALEAWRAEHQPWSEQGRVLIEQQTHLIEESSAKSRALIESTAKELREQIAMYANAHNASTWRDSMREALRDVLPDELLDFERQRQSLEDQERGRALREWREKNLTPGRVFSGFLGLVTLLASPTVIVWFLNQYW